jgi:HSP20 family protein
MSRPGAQPIAVNAFETDHEVVVVAAMPGTEPEDISVRLEADTLHIESTVRGEEADRRYVLREWSYGPYSRAIRLSTPVDARAANVTYGNGVLTLVLPRSESFVSAGLSVPKTGLARGAREGHTGGGDSGFGPPRQGRRA